MAEPDRRPVTMEELLVSSLAQTDALAKLLIEKELITREKFMQKIAEEHHRPSEAVFGVSIPRCDRPNNKRRDQTEHYQA